MRQSSIRTCASARQENSSTAALDRERLASELVDDVQQLEVVTVGGLIELEVDRPHMIRRLGPQPVGLPQLPNDLLRRVTSPLHVLAPLTHSTGPSKLSHGSAELRGSGHDRSVP